MLKYLITRWLPFNLQEAERFFAHNRLKAISGLKPVAWHS